MRAGKIYGRGGQMKRNSTENNCLGSLTGWPLQCYDILVCTCVSDRVTGEGADGD